MAKNKNLEKLESMLGKQWIYDYKKFTLLTYKIGEDKVSIELITDNEWITDNVLNLGVTLSLFKEGQLYTYLP